MAAEDQVLRPAVEPGRAGVADGAQQGVR
jgi:hypothetical protein